MDKNKKNLNLSKKKIQSNLKELFDESIKEHLTSDTEIATCLSGGNDSTSITSKSNSFLEYNMKTFTYEFEDQIKNKDSEMHIAKKFAKKNKLKNFTALVTPKYVKDNFEKLIFNVESPITNPFTKSTPLLIAAADASAVVISLLLLS